MDVVVASELVAGLLAAGGVKELGEAAGGGLVAGIIGRVRKMFGSDARSLDALEQARQAATDSAVQELASALTWYARRDQAFAEELAAWGELARTGGMTQTIAADHSVAAGGDVTITASGGGTAAGVCPLGACRRTSADRLRLALSRSALDRGTPGPPVLQACIRAYEMAAVSDRCPSC